MTFFVRNIGLGLIVVSHRLFIQTVAAIISLQKYLRLGEIGRLARFFKILNLELSLFSPSYIILSKN